MSWVFFNSLHSDDHQSSEELQRRTDSLSAGGASFSITHSQLPGVSSFFPAPPPAPQSPSSETSMDSSALPSPQGLAGVLNDLAEIGGSLKAGLSLLSRIRAVSRISGIFDGNRKTEKEEEGDYDDDDEDEDDYVAGINDEIIMFANQISERSACWTDFPLSLEDDFNFSDAQRQHAASIEYMVPSLRALRVSLQGYMTSEQFWMVYFILLLPRLDEYDMEILSSSQIVNTRNRLMQKLQNSKNEKAETSEDVLSNSLNASPEIRTEEDEQNSEPRLKPEHAGASMSMNSKKVEDESAVLCSDDDSVFSARLSTSSHARGLREPSPGGSSAGWVHLNCGYESRGGGSSQRSWQSIHRGKDSDADSTASEWHRVYESD